MKNCGTGDWLGAASIGILALGIGIGEGVAQDVNDAPFEENWAPSEWESLSEEEKVARAAEFASGDANGQAHRTYGRGATEQLPSTIVSRSSLQAQLGLNEVGA